MANNSQPQAICTHSNPDSFVVFSVYREERELFRNMKTHSLTIEHLQHLNISFKEAEGSYKGVKEESFVVNAKHKEEIKYICKTANQESYLLLQPHKHGLFKATLIYLADDSREFIGYLREAPQDIAKMQDAYTYRKDINKYWIVTEEDTTQNNQLLWDKLLLKKEVKK